MGPGFDCKVVNLWPCVRNVYGFLNNSWQLDNLLKREHFTFLRDTFPCLTGKAPCLPLTSDQRILNQVWFIVCKYTKFLQMMCLKHEHKNINSLDMLIFSHFITIWFCCCLSFLLSWSDIYDFVTLLERNDMGPVSLIFPESDLLGFIRQ